MPPGREGQLGAETYRQIAALIRSSGDRDPAVLAAIGFGPAAPQTGTTRTPAPSSGARRPSPSRGMSTTHDALYTNSKLALDPRTGQVAWFFQRDIRNATVGEPVPACPGYFGGRNCMASAYSPETSWESRLGHAAHGHPITYAVGGKQYVAVPTGLGVFRIVSTSLSPEICPPPSGNAIYVFAVPD